MLDPTGLRLLRCLVFVAALAMPAGFSANGQTNPAPSEKAQTDKPAAPAPKPAPSTPAIKEPPSATPPTSAPSTTTPGTKEPPAPPPAPKQPPTAAPDTSTPEGKPSNTEIERNGSPGIPDNATTESVNIPVRTAVMVPGQSSYDDAFKSIKASMDKVKQAMEKAGLKPSGHPITIFSEPDDKGFKYKFAIPIGAKPEGKPDLGGDVTIGETPSGKAIKFQHRGAYEDIDSTYDVITAYLDAKGLQVDNPYIEEYLTDLTTPDDPNLQVDIYVFVK